MAIVLAAGRSLRLRAVTGGGSKALVRLGGLPLVERAVRSLWAVGIADVVVVVGYNAGPVAAVVSRLARAGHVRAVMAEGWELGNGASLRAARTVAEGQESFVLMTADHVFGEGALTGLMSASAPAVLVDRHPDAETWEEGTRVRERDGSVVAIGKELDEPAVECGAFVLAPEVFDHQDDAAAAGDHSLAGAVSRLASVRPFTIVPLPQVCWWQDIDTPSDLSAARRRLRSSLVKSGDGPVSRYLNRPISTRISVAVASLRPAPDLLSVLAAMVGVLSGWLLSVGAGIAGGLLVHATSVLDGVDGESARLQMRASPRGAMLDGVLDRIADAAILAGLGIWALRFASAETCLVLTVAATTGAILSMATKDRAAALTLPQAPERVLGWVLGGRDGRLLLVTAFALAGLPVVALIAVTATSAVSLVARVAFVRRVVRRSR
jgi:CDP-L-myo-inositol myo-inositolphosphotransferase